MNDYLQNHKSTRYLPNEKLLPGLKKYTNRYGWDDFYIGRNLIFSHRLTTYDLTAFPEKFHTHNFYEVVIFESGNISYLAENYEIFPYKGDIIIFPPGLFHTARLSEKSQYERYVFYFDAQLFDFLSRDNLPLLLKSVHVGCRSVEDAKKCKLFYLLERIEYTVRQEDLEAGLLAFGYIIQLFHLISQHTEISKNSIAAIPQNVLSVKNYIDDNFQNLNTTLEVASHFFYSREYVSRMFKQYFNINLSEYLINKKISCAKNALEMGKSVTYAFNAAGYRSMSAFVNAFRKYTSATPSEYRRLHCTGKPAAKHLTCSRKSHKYYSN